MSFKLIASENMGGDGQAAMMLLRFTRKSQIGAHAGEKKTSVCFVLGRSEAVVRDCMCVCLFVCMYCIRLAN